MDLIGVQIISQLSRRFKCAAGAGKLRCKRWSNVGGHDSRMLHQWPRREGWTPSDVVVCCLQRIYTDTLSCQHCCAFCTHREIAFISAVQKNKPSAASPLYPSLVHPGNWLCTSKASLPCPHYMGAREEERLQFLLLQRQQPSQGRWRICPPDFTQAPAYV